MQHGRYKKTRRKGYCCSCCNGPHRQWKRTKQRETGVRQQGKLETSKLLKSFEEFKPKVPIEYIVASRKASQ